MRRAMILTGILGGGSALTFAAAAVAASMFPSGAMVSSNGWVMNDLPDRRGPVPIDRVWIDGGPVPVPMPAGPFNDLEEVTSEGTLDLDVTNRFLDASG